MINQKRDHITLRVDWVLIIEMERTVCSVQLRSTTECLLNTFNSSVLYVTIWRRDGCNHRSEKLVYFSVATWIPARSLKFMASSMSLVSLSITITSCSMAERWAVFFELTEEMVFQESYGQSMHAIYGIKHGSQREKIDSALASTALFEIPQINKILPQSWNHPPIEY